MLRKLLGQGFCRKNLQDAVINYYTKNFRVIEYTTFINQTIVYINLYHVLLKTRQWKLLDELVIMTLFCACVLVLTQWRARLVSWHSAIGGSGDPTIPTLSQQLFPKLEPTNQNRQKKKYRAICTQVTKRDFRVTCHA